MKTWTKISKSRRENSTGDDVLNLGMEQDGSKKLPLSGEVSFDQSTLRVVSTDFYSVYQMVHHYVLIKP